MTKIAEADREDKADCWANAYNPSTGPEQCRTLWDLLFTFKNYDKVHKKNVILAGDYNSI